MKNEPNTKTTAETDGIRVLKTAHTPSLSGKSKLSYELGQKDRDTYFRLIGNSQSGAFNDDWIAWNEIHTLLGKASTAGPITGASLGPLYSGQSMNSPFFLFAVLREEGLVKPSADKKRCYEKAEPARFLAHVRALANGEKPIQAGKTTPKGKKPMAGPPSKPKTGNKKTKASQGH